MAKLLRIIPVTTVLSVAAFIGTIRILWPLDGTLWFAAIVGLGVFIFCALIEGCLFDIFTSL